MKKITKFKNPLGTIIESEGEWKGKYNKQLIKVEVANTGEVKFIANCYKEMMEKAKDLTYTERETLLNIETSEMFGCIYTYAICENLDWKENKLVENYDGTTYCNGNEVCKQEIEIILMTKDYSTTIVIPYESFSNGEEKPTITKILSDVEELYEDLYDNCEIYGGFINEEEELAFKFYNNNGKEEEISIENYSSLADMIVSAKVIKYEEKIID